jgi:hypothetical protein
MQVGYLYDTTHSWDAALFMPSVVCMAAGCLVYSVFARNHPIDFDAMVSAKPVCQIAAAGTFGQHHVAGVCQQLVALQVSSIQLSVLVTVCSNPDTGKQQLLVRQAVLSTSQHNTSHLNMWGSLF